MPMQKTNGWGIPFLGCISLSCGLWALIILSGGQLIQALSPFQDSQMVRTAGLAPKELN